MLYIGIDPGKSGGIATIKIVDENKIQLVYMEYSDDNLKLVTSNALLHKGPVFAVVEKVGAMPGQGVTSMFNFGKSYGYILGVLEARGISYQLVPPQTWKKEFSLSSDKNKSIEVCKRLFPSVNLKRTERCTKDHDGMAEALLLAEYGKRKNL